MKLIAELSDDEIKTALTTYVQENIGLSGGRVTKVDLKKNEITYTTDSTEAPAATQEAPAPKPKPKAVATTPVEEIVEEEKPAPKTAKKGSMFTKNKTATKPKPEPKPEPEVEQVEEETEVEEETPQPGVDEPFNESDEDEGFTVENDVATEDEQPETQEEDEQEEEEKPKKPSIFNRKKK